MAAAGFNALLTSLRTWGQRARALYLRLDDGSELPPASVDEIRWARRIALVASSFFFVVALWEIGAPFGAGHFAASTAVALGGENMLRFRTVLPLIDYPLAAPTSADCYCHHPFGIFWTSALLVGALGHHDFVCRLPPLLLSGLTPPLLYLLGRALWSPLSGALAAVGFVFTPIALSYANFNALEVPVIFATLLAAFGYVRLRQTGRRRFTVLSVLALLMAINSDWPAYVFAAGLLLLSFVDTFVRGRRLDTTSFRRRAYFFAFAVVGVGVVGFAYLFGLLGLGQLEELLQQGRARSLGSERELTQVLASRRYWILLMFTPVAIAVGKLAAPIFAARLLIKRSDLELLPLLMLGMATFQYLLFAQGADVHVFWPHYFAPYFALALGGLGQSLRELVNYGASRFRPGEARAAHWALGAGALGFAVPLVMAHDALVTLGYARKTGGRFNEKGRFIQPDKDKVAALEFLAKKLTPGAVVGLDANMKKSLWVPWALGRPTKVVGASTFDRKEGYLITDARFASDRLLRDNAAEYATTVVGPFWLFDLKRKDPNFVEAYGIERREPNLFERYFVSSTHALREVVPDPFWTWEIKEHLLKGPNPEPTVAPRGPEQLRIAHNMAVRRADPATAARLRAQLLAALDRKVETLYEDGSRLLGMSYESAASDVLSLYFESSGAADQRFRVRSRVEAKLPWSLVPADSLEWEVGLPTTLPRNVWKRGFLYSSVTELMRRPGRERYIGDWINTGPELPLRKHDGSRDVTLLVLP